MINLTARIEGSCSFEQVLELRQSKPWTEASKLKIYIGIEA